MTRRIIRRAPAILLACVFFLSGSAGADDLKQEALAAYNHYLQLTQVQIDSELAQATPYLWIDAQPQTAHRDAYYGDLRKGGVVIERLETLDNGKAIAAPGALIHHWIGTVFIPGATLAQTLEFMQDYDHKKDYFRPDIQRSKILQHQGDDFLVNLRFYKKKILTIVDDTDHQVHYHIVDATHAWSRSHATRIQEVENPGEPNERRIRKDTTAASCGVWILTGDFSKKTAELTWNANQFRSRATFLPDLVGLSGRSSRVSRGSR